MSQDHEKYMERCLELAATAKYRGKTAVGSLIVRSGEIIAEGIEGDSKLPDVLSHSEALAVLAAIETTGSRDLSGCSLYTTVEPCFMCSYLIRQMRVGTVVYGVKIMGAGGASSNYPILKASDINKWAGAPVVIGGILKDECERMLSTKE